jgi:hypothetical protein
MFYDLAGSTALSERLDPEVLREVIQIYRATCAEVINRYEGHIAQYLGDELLVYFIYPAAHEDDATRVVRAGLEIIRTLRLQVPSPLAGEGQGEGDKVSPGTVFPPILTLPRKGERNSGLTESWGFAWLAEAYGKRGQVKEGLALLAEALDHVDKSGEHVYEAELYRLKGELLLAQAKRRRTRRI